RFAAERTKLDRNLYMRSYVDDFGGRIVGRSCPTSSDESRSFVVKSPGTGGYTVLESPHFHRRSLEHSGDLASPDTANCDNTNVATPQMLNIAVRDAPLPHLCNVILQLHKINFGRIDISDIHTAAENILTNVLM